MEILVREEDKSKEQASTPTTREIIRAARAAIEAQNHPRTAKPAAVEPRDKPTIPKDAKTGSLSAGGNRSAGNVVKESKDKLTTNAELKPNSPWTKPKPKS
jgi:hypothetical protein